MDITNGTHLGPYEIVSRIGAGGMGEVFKARDKRLDRSVAVKILPREFSRNTQLQIRFEREAKTISQLTHPHICTLHDVGNENGISYLVMELIEGESLADRLTKGPLPLSDVIRFGAQLAEALGKAHRAGVVHRDLKPGNVMLTKNGIKLLDFGLAKSRDAALVTSGTMELDGATEHKPLTQEGTILGTFQYMSPEQLEGAEADARSDIFALGAVLYEMATGQRAFQGKNRTSLIAAIVSGQPRSIAETQPMAPPALEHVIRRCLEKDPDDRWQSAQDVAEELRWISEAGSQASIALPVAIRRKHREWLAWALAALALAALIPLGWIAWRERAQIASPVESAILPPEDAPFILSDGAMQLSPDGKKLAFLAEVSGQRMLWVRALANPIPQVLTGTEDASYPFWSPDSRQIAFFAGGKLRKIDASGGPAQTICDAQPGRGGSWNKNNIILFSIVRDGIYQTVATGEKAVKITSVDTAAGEADHRWPWFLSDGRRYLYLARAEDPEDSVVWLASLDSKTRTRIVQASGQPSLVGGYLLYTRHRTLLAQPFDESKGTLTGDSVPLAENISYIGGIASANYSANSDFVAIARGSSKSQLTWFDENGHDLGRIGDAAQYVYVSFSPDGKRVATEIADSSDKSSVWMMDLTRASASRFTFGNADVFGGAWSPDGQLFTYGAGRKLPAIDLMSKPTLGSGAEQTIWENDSQRIPASWARNGDVLVALHNPKKKVVNDIWLYNVETRKATPLVESTYSEFPGTFSPDGEWFVYDSNESGRAEVYAQPIGRPGKWQISTNGGTAPRWSVKGDRIFYVSPERKIMAVPVTIGATLQAGDPKPLFELRSRLSTAFLPYDVSPDGRFLIADPIRDNGSDAFHLISNWTALAKSKRE